MNKKIWNEVLNESNVILESMQSLNDKNYQWKDLKDGTKYMLFISKYQGQEEFYKGTGKQLKQMVIRKVTKDGSIEDYDTPEEAAEYFWDELNGDGDDSYIAFKL